MKRLYAPFLQQLWSENGNAPILPEHLLAKYNDDKGSFNTAPYNSLPVGSGPFKVVAWNRGQDVRMVANPDFYLGRAEAEGSDLQDPSRREYRGDAAANARARHARAGNGSQVAGVRGAGRRSAQRLESDSRRRLRLVARRLQSRGIRSSATCRCAARSRMRPIATKSSIRSRTARRFRRTPISSRTTRGRTPTTSSTIRTIRQRPRRCSTRTAGRSDPTAFGSRTVSVSSSR